MLQMNETPKAQLKESLLKRKCRRSKNSSTVEMGRDKLDWWQWVATRGDCCWLEGAPSDGDTIQAEDLRFIPNNARAKLNDRTGNGVEVPNLVGFKPLQQLSQALDEAAFFFAAVVVGVAKFQKYQVIWRVMGQESASRGGRVEGPMLATQSKLREDSPGGLMAPKC